MTNKEKIAYYLHLRDECNTHEEMVQKVVDLRLSLADAITVFMFVFNIDVAITRKLLFSRDEYANEAKQTDELTDDFFGQLNT